jgi:hypothetical protein
MKHLELLAKNENVLLYYTKDYALITDKLIASMEWPKAVPLLGFAFNPFAPKGGCLGKKVKGDYVVRYMYGAKTSSLKPVGKEMKSSPLTLRPPKNAKETLAITKATLGKYTAGNRSKNGTRFSEEVKNYLAMIRKVRSVLVFKDGKNVGIASLLDGVRLEGGKCSTLTWLWISPQLPPAQRKDALYKATKWVKDNALEYIASCEFAYDRKSQQQDSQMGLKPYRIFFAHK